ncbi:hypothetical protein B0T22DRAFT_41262 [Podospora appendiculata]|uniref:SPRY domain-containing protein n=1 Tax=Podospora appendiculata TaxID=314037 RepID=A0AAE0XHF5_9PEZI|nr:hypothetical protein B0T22DRAFT_41262 [Podospora appendiculata]
MCFGRKDTLYDEEPPRPVQGHFPQQPTYASTTEGPKASMPSPVQAYSPPPAQQPAYAPVSPVQAYPPPSAQHQQQQPYQQPQPYQPPPVELAAAAPVELSVGDDVAPPPGPPPSHRPRDDYAAPPGPPPSRRPDEEYAAPPGPPPSRRPDDDYAAPPGPPPSHQPDNDYIAPPTGPPPSHTKPPAPQHDWQSIVPDTSLFPPPPSFFSGYDRSPVTNAPEAEAEAGERWCAQHPLTPPLHLDPIALSALTTHNIRLMQPAVGFAGTLNWSAPGVWVGRTDPKATDSCIIGYPPLYCVTQHSPLAGTRRAKTIYYEVTVRPDAAHRGDNVCLALGFAALPYPSFRMPGWHRGSLAVHGDDGHKFINDRWGGKAFTTPFRRGETYGVGMTFREEEGRVEVEVFFTRQGKESGRWNLHEETDSAQDLPVTGLEGFHDLSCAVGTYGGVSFEAVFEPKRWLYRGVV